MATNNNQQKTCGFSAFENTKTGETWFSRYDKTTESYVRLSLTVDEDKAQMVKDTLRVLMDTRGRECKPSSKSKRKTSDVRMVSVYCKSDEYVLLPNGDMCISNLHLSQFN